MAKSDNAYPIQIHFKGTHFDARSVPIYELGETFLAIQRMVIQGYLIALETGKKKEGRTTAGEIQHKINNKKIREDLSLRLVGHARGSDAYLLDWFNSVALFVAPHLLSAALGIVFEAGLKYMAHSVTSEPSSLPARMMFNEFLVLANRIKRVGDIDSIEIHVKDKPHPIVIDRNTKAYLKPDNDIPMLAERTTTVVGRVVTAHILSHEVVDVDPVKPRWLDHRIKVDMSDVEFDDVLAHSVGRRNTLFKFIGNARLRPGDDEHNFREFKAKEVSTVRGLKPKRPAKKVKTRANKKHAKKPVVARKKRKAIRKPARRK